MSKREYVYRRTPMRFEVVDRAFLDGSPFVHLKPIDGEPEGTLEVPWEDFVRDYSDEEPVPPWRPTEATEDKPAGLGDEAAAETAWEESRKLNGIPGFTWDGLATRGRAKYIFFARRFRDLTSPKTEPKPHAMPAAEIDVEALARAAWQMAMRPDSACNDWSDVPGKHQQRYLAFTRFVIDAVANLQPPATVESRVGQWVPRRYLWGAPESPDNQGSRVFVTRTTKGGVNVATISVFGNDDPPLASLVFVSKWDAARARWIADGRPAS